MMSIDKVKEFYSVFGHPIKVKPTVPNKGLRELRVNLIAEELGELCTALGVVLTLNVDATGAISVDVFASLGNNEVDLVGAADALGHIDYVVKGANLVFGLPAEEITDEIHRSNMTKLGKNGEPIYDEYGKVVKGPDYKPPDIVSILDNKLKDTSAKDFVDDWLKKA